MILATVTLLKIIGLKNYLLQALKITTGIRFSVFYSALFIIITPANLRVNLFQSAANFTLLFFSIRLYLN